MGWVRETGWQVRVATAERRTLVVQPNVHSRTGDADTYFTRVKVVQRACSLHGRTLRMPRQRHGPGPTCAIATCHHMRK